MSEIKKDESVVVKTPTTKVVKEKKTAVKAAAKKALVKKGIKVVKKSTKANSSPKLSPEEVKKQIEAKIDAFFEANKEFGIKKLVSATKLMEVGANIGTYSRF